MGYYSHDQPSARQKLDQKAVCTGSHPHTFSFLRPAPALSQNSRTCLPSRRACDSRPSSRIRCDGQCAAQFVAYLACTPPRVQAPALQKPSMTIQVYHLSVWRQKQNGQELRVILSCVACLKNKQTKAAYNPNFLLQQNSRHLK